jgi:hypothetical protein
MGPVGHVIDLTPGRSMLAAGDHRPDHGCLAHDPETEHHGEDRLNGMS